MRGLKALHDLKIVHRDIKCANLFLTKSGVLKLGDLNVSKVAKKGLLSTQTGTPYYASPEVWKDQPYNHSSDIWSLGCVLYEMITLLPPFRAQSMQALASKVTRGVYDRIPTHFSSDLNQMVKSCLQVMPASRPSCDKILATPGLLNHLTGTLEDLDVDPEDSKSNDNLLKTIRCPRNLGMITERLPAPQYQPKIKRCNSMAIDGSKAKLEVDKEQNRKSDLTKENVEKVLNEKRIGAARMIGNLPTIEEDQVDDETIDVLSRLERQVSKVNQIVCRPKVARQQSKARLDYNSDCQRVEKQLSNGKAEPVCQSEQQSRQGPRYKPPVNPRSADVYSKKAKMAPHYKQALGLHSNGSDNDDTSTRVSSKSQAQRNHVYQKQNVNLDYYMPRDSQTPSQILNSKLENKLNKPNYINDKVNQQNGGHESLPEIKPHGRLQSVDLDRMDREKKLNAYLVPAQIAQSARGNSRYQNHRNESLGVSRALGLNHNRYEGVQSAIRMARAASKDSIPTLPARGPCPNYLSKVQSNRQLHGEIEKPTALLNRYQSEARGLQAVYASRRHLQVAQSADYEYQQGRVHNYNYAQIPNSRFKHY